MCPSYRIYENGAVGREYLSPHVVGIARIARQVDNGRHAPLELEQDRRAIDVTGKTKFWVRNRSYDAGHTLNGPGRQPLDNVELVNSIVDDQATADGWVGESGHGKVRSHVDERIKTGSPTAPSARSLRAVTQGVE